MALDFNKNHYFLRKLQKKPVWGLFYFIFLLFQDIASCGAFF